MAVELRYTKSFKKYTNEFNADVTEHVRSWSSGQELMAFHEDDSLVKVTGTKRQITALLEDLKEKFDYIPPEDAEK